MSGIGDAALDVGKFLLEHGDIVEDVVEKLAGGTPKDAVKAAIRGVKIQVSRDALEEELRAADERRRMG